MQCGRDGLQALLIPRAKTSQLTSSDTGGGNRQVKRGGPKPHRDHREATDGESIKAGLDHQYE